MRTGLAWIDRQSRRRLKGKIIPPCLRPGQPSLGSRRWLPLPVTTPYGATGNPAWSLGRHTGEDHAAPVGSPACAVSWGRVVCVARWTGPGEAMREDPAPAPSFERVRQWGDAYGTHIVIRTGDGRFDYALCHLSRVFVRVGDSVRPGETVGLTGHSGGSGTFGPHLHLEARPAGGRFGSDIHPINVKRLDPNRVH